MIVRFGQPVTRIPERIRRRVIAARVTWLWGPARINYLMGLLPFTVSEVITWYGLAKRAWLDRATGRVIRRYQQDARRQLIHVHI
jgi:hypothetical protein